MVDRELASRIVSLLNELLESCEVSAADERQPMRIGFGIEGKRGSE